TPPPTRRGQAVRANSITSDASPYPEAPQATSKPEKVATQYHLPPTIPSPFTGNLEASLDAVLEWGSRYAGTQAIVDTLLQKVITPTDWPGILRNVYTFASAPPGLARYLVEELLFLVTRTLLPEQISENRGILGRLYDRKKQLAIRVVLRYDMLREWKMEQGTHHRDQAVAIPSLPPTGLEPPPPIAVERQDLFPHRRPLLPNIIPTIIAAPPGGFTTHGVRERMKHHVTDLDEYLLLKDEKVADWSDMMLVGMTSQVVLQWQWLRQNNEILQEMEVYGWEELDGLRDECEWIADDVKR
ncbi:hypothetical protein EJ02DRAFT_302969, partial [Clathrospora elynae]